MTQWNPVIKGPQCQQARAWGHSSEAGVQSIWDLPSLVRTALRGETLEPERGNSCSTWGKGSGGLTFDPDLAMVPRLDTSSSCVIPMPVSWGERQAKHPSECTREPGWTCGDTQAQVHQLHLPGGPSKVRTLSPEKVNSSHVSQASLEKTSLEDRHID